MTVFYFLVFVLAVRAVLEAWFEGSIFEPMRQYLKRAVQAEAEAAAADPANPVDFANAAVTPVSAYITLFNRWAPKWLFYLLSCRFCLTYHVTFWLFMFCYALPVLLRNLYLPVVAETLAATPFMLACIAASNLLSKAADKLN